VEGWEGRCGTYETCWAESAVDVEEADCVLDGTFIERGDDWVDKALSCHVVWLCSVGCLVVSRVN
jgi:hypothetical protein